MVLSLNVTCNFTPKGQRRHRSKMIGKLAESEGEMYPNANYYKLYSLPENASEILVKE